jgi:hypothetical protein
MKNFVSNTITNYETKNTIEHSYDYSSLLCIENYCITNYLLKMEHSLKLLKETLEEITELEIQDNDLDMLNDLMYTKNDFHFEIDKQEYRCINADAIWSIYRDEQEDCIRDSYFSTLDEIPWWLEIDWERTCENLLNADGYGNHFNHYDGSENEFRHENELWYLFRTN